MEAPSWNNEILLYTADEPAGKWHRAYLENFYWLFQVKAAQCVWPLPCPPPVPDATPYPSHREFWEPRTMRSPTGSAWPCHGLWC